MTEIDYETEYNNRARVPEHPQVMEGWVRDAAAYRAARPEARIGISYGPSARQTLDIFPAPGAGDDAPLAMFVHGGWWRSLDPSSFSHMAAGPNARGVTVAVAGYDLCPQVTIAQIIDQIRAACLLLWRTYRKRFVVYGHSAGGHLSACMTATNWTTLDPDVPGDLVPAGYAISGLFDLVPLTHTSMNTDFRMTETSARMISPINWPVPRGRTLDAVVGARESNEFLRQSQTMAEVWSGHAHTHYAALPDADHFTVLAPLTGAGSAMTARVSELARHPQGISR
ncbi:MAG TPA: alpha/beta hydrolase [Pseudolabrys sp.]|nr:alpha/beta hydrolase [Pseudolabrys sp.]